MNANIKKQLLSRIHRVGVEMMQLDTLSYVNQVALRELKDLRIALEMVRVKIVEIKEEP